MYVHNEDLVRVQLAYLRALIEKDRAVTMHRCDGLHLHEGSSRQKREEWQYFYRRTAVLEREIEAVVKALAQVYALKTPPPILIVCEPK